LSEKYSTGVGVREDDFEDGTGDGDAPVQVRDMKKSSTAKLTGRVKVAMVATPRAQPGEVVVHMLCRPVHPADLLSLAGTYPPWQPPRLPATLGLEGMGIVHEVHK
jgi:NADPH:quinone reductase-like Zn-dependent oxidoreductase